jgi:short-subunit dehydrogenase
MALNSSRTWLIIGATSILAQEFAHLAVSKGHSLVLVGRNAQALQQLQVDYQLRYKMDCHVLVVNLETQYKEVVEYIQNSATDVDLFICHSVINDNHELNPPLINKMINTNVTSTIQIVHAYLQKKQSHRNLIFISSVAAVRGRGKNSLYGASKAAVEVYLQGMQQINTNNCRIAIIRMGYIDTKSTFGKTGVFYAAPPKKAARYCWKALSKNKKLSYYPAFWVMLMWIIKKLPFFLYKKLTF